MAGIGVFVDPKTGEVMVAQSLYVAGEAALFLVALVLGMVAGWLALP